MKLILFIFLTLQGVLMASSALPKYYEETLENGLKIVAIPMDNDSKVITTDIFYNVGSRDEIMGKVGLRICLSILISNQQKI